LLEEIRQWCEASGIGGHGGSVSFSGRRGGREYRGTATRFRDELSILIHAEGEGRRRYRIPGLWSDYSWLVLYQEPLSGEWRSWPGAAKEPAGIYDTAPGFGGGMAGAYIPPPPEKPGGPAPPRPRHSFLSA
jgi:hypothetical protein